VVVIETVGVGQSETDVEEVTDTVAVIVQPASGDTLQFLKAGIMEVPDVLVVTKADLGDVATRSRRDLGQALKAVGSAGRARPGGVVRCRRRAGSRSSPTRSRPTASARVPLRAARARARGRALREFTAEHGERALRELGGRRAAERLLAEQDAGASVTDLLRRSRRAR
jgi:LAO/AO transport system kinase